MGDEAGGTRWAEVLAKATAILAMHAAKIDDDLLKRAAFLEGLGVTAREAAEMLGAHVGSLRNAKSRARKGGRRGKGEK